MKEKGYELKSAKVGFIVYWRKEGEEQEVKIILPEMYFERKSSSGEGNNKPHVYCLN
jgi:ATP-dependent DNA helicase RecQ